MKFVKPNGKEVEIDNPSIEWVEAVKKLGWEEVSPKPKRTRRTKAEMEAAKLDTGE